MSGDLTYRNDLERRFDGPIPPEENLRAAWGLEVTATPERVAGRRLMWAAAVKCQIRLIRQTQRIAGTEGHRAALWRELTALRLYFRSANRDYWRLKRGG